MVIFIMLSSNAFCESVLDEIKLKSGDIGSVRSIVDRNNLDSVTERSFNYSSKGSKKHSSGLGVNESITQWWWFKGIGVDGKKKKKVLGQRYKIDYFLCSSQDEAMKLSNMIRSSVQVLSEEMKQPIGDVSYNTGGTIVFSKGRIVVSVSGGITNSEIISVAKKILQKIKAAGY